MDSISVDDIEFPGDPGKYGLFFTKSDCGPTLLLSLTVPLLLHGTLFDSNLLFWDTGYELESVLIESKRVF